MHGRAFFIGVLAVSLTAVAGCERAKAPVNGIGGFELSRTSLGEVQAGSACFEKGAIMRCASGSSLP